MIHPQSFYETIHGKHCGCGKYRSRQYILRRLRGSMDIRKSSGNEYCYVECKKCGTTLAEYQRLQKQSFNYQRIEEMKLQEFIHYSLGKR